MEVTNFISPTPYIFPSSHSNPNTLSNDEAVAISGSLAKEIVPEGELELADSKMDTDEDTGAEFFDSYCLRST